MFLAGLGSASLAVATGLAARPAAAANQGFGPGRLSGLPWHSGCSLNGISAFEAYRGRPCDGYTMWNLHRTWSDIPAFKGGWPELRKRPGRLSIGLAPFPDNQSAVRNGGQWTAAARGAYDSVYTLFSQRLAASGRTNVVVRIGWEHNHTFPWFSGSNPQGYKDTFRRIADILRRHNPTVLIDWTNVKNGSKSSVAETYPGDDWVDSTTTTAGRRSTTRRSGIGSTTPPRMATHGASAPGWRSPRAAASRFPARSGASRSASRPAPGTTRSTSRRCSSSSGRTRRASPTRTISTRSRGTS
jgi:hypothetical protein